ncbi:Uncharacterised protein [Acinetobacter baumannii]|nr:Uncharacterised protein [Acinetobacter baumannii]
MRPRIGSFSRRSSFCAGIFEYTPIWNLVQMRGTPNSRVGRARFMSSTKVSRLSAKNTVVPP